MTDPGVIYATLAAIVANRTAGDPLWLLLVGPPSSGKTEALRAARGESDCRFIGTITEAGLMSGTPIRQKAKGAKGGLLQEVGEFGILLLKDFTTVLSMSHDARNALLAALREIYDGSWTRTVGSDGGRSLSWDGKLGIVGGVTGAIDSAHAVMSMMGERFLLYRITEQSSPRQADIALERQTPIGVMRKELAAAVADVLAGVHTPEEMPPTGDDKRWISPLATLVARMRSSVERDPYTREVVLFHESEAPARLALNLRQMLHAARAIGLDESAARDLVRKVGLDSSPVVRQKVFRMILGTSGLTATNITEKLDYPLSTTRRALEDITGHGLAFRETRGKEVFWFVTALGKRWWERAFSGQEPSENGGGTISEKSEGGEREGPPIRSSISQFTVVGDFSENVSDAGLSYEEVERRAIQAECLGSTGTEG